MSKAESNKVSTFIVGTIGIVYGDIGTSPLYALKNYFLLHNLDVSSFNILGIISLIFWALVIVVSYKYIHLILRADNHGEGGILALLTLCLSIKNKPFYSIVLFLGILGTALFYGDGVITPAISVLGALEGLSVVSSVFDIYVPVLSLVLLIFLFLAQKNGSKKIGLLFGPIMIVWFSTIAILGSIQIYQSPEILLAVNPYYAYHFFTQHGIIAFLTFGAIVLVVTGAEALYADIGHFNKKSIQYSWHYFVFPALLLNYFGQGSLLLTHPEAIENPFYFLVPSWALYSVILIATLATIIASQSIISGIFSISWQAIQLGYFPRMRVIHTSSQQIGQVYVPLINYLLLLGTLSAVFIFKNSENLASIYGITITWIMLITTLLAALLSYYSWQWSLIKIIFVFAPLLIIDIIFWGSSSLKILEGGWFPLLITSIVYLIITTWRRGREALVQESDAITLNLQDFIHQITQLSSFRIPGTVIFMCRAPDKIPSTLTIHLQHNKFLHEKIIFLSIIVKEKPKVLSSQRIKIHKLEEGIYQVTAYYGFIEVPDLQAIFEQIKGSGIDLKFDDITFMLSRGVPVSSPATYLSGWREKLFIFLSHNALNATDFFKIPHERVVELGVRFKI